MAHLHFDFTFQALVTCYCFAELKKAISFCRLSNDFQIACPAQISTPPKLMDHVNHESSFRSINLYPKRLGHKSIEKIRSVIYSTDLKLG